MTKTLFFTDLSTKFTMRKEAQVPGCTSETVFYMTYISLNKCKLIAYITLFLITFVNNRLQMEIDCNIVN